ncbi:MAG TPA: peptidoglycan editing factor PgeF [Stellaceae bacterium]|nr:peptidoglycan editing factor PgeF [Stellaceae bacterium]
MISLPEIVESGIRHAFFTRRGGVSEGYFSSLNCGFGSGDRAENVVRNRAVAMERLDLAAERLVTCYQVHSAEAVIVERVWRPAEAPRADGLVTRQPGIALGVLAADCGPVLFADPAARVIGAAHAGWRGARAGVLEATIARMEELGAERGRILAAIGPCIGSRSYEVGPEFVETFLADDPGNQSFFAPARRQGHALFDLAGHIARRLATCGVAAIGCARHDTVEEEDLFFSYRRAALRGEPSYGRGLSAIALEG